MKKPAKRKKVKKEKYQIVDVYTPGRFRIYGKYSKVVQVKLP